MQSLCRVYHFIESTFFTKNTHFPFDHLPEELQAIIFSYLTPQGHAILPQISRSWKRISEDDFIWRIIAEEGKFSIYKKHFDKSWKSHCKTVYMYDPYWVDETAKRGSISSILKVASNSDNYFYFDKFWRLWQEEKKFDRVFKLLSQAPKLNGKMAFELGKLYFYGMGTKSNWLLAHNYFLYGAEMQNSEAMNALGFMYQKGLGIEKDINEGITWLMRSAEKENPEALFNIGYSYYTGLGVKQDYRLAYIYYRNAAELNELDAINALGNMYLEGHGIPKDETLAFNFYYQAALKGHPLSMYNIAFMYMEGLGVKQNLTEANSWLKKSAEKGCVDAILLIVSFIKKGQYLCGVEEHNTFYRYIDQAKSSGNLTDDERKDIERLSITID